MISTRNGYTLNNRQAFFIIFFTLLILASVILGSACRTVKRELTKEDIYTYPRNKILAISIPYLI